MSLTRKWVETEEKKRCIDMIMYAVVWMLAVDLVRYYPVTRLYIN